MLHFFAVLSLRGKRVENQYGAKKKARSASEGDTRCFTHACFSRARVSRAPYILNAPATQAMPSSAKQQREMTKFILWRT